MADDFNIHDMSWFKRVRWLPCENNSSTLTIPAFGVVRLVSVDADSTVLKVDRPNANGQEVYINGPWDIPPGGSGLCSFDQPIHALYSSGTPAASDTWGATSGAYTLTKDNAGFNVAGDVHTDVKTVMVTRSTGSVNLAAYQVSGILGIVDQWEGDGLKFATGWATGHPDTGTKLPDTTQPYAYRERCDDIETGVIGQNLVAVGSATGSGSSPVVYGRWFVIPTPFYKWITDAGGTVDSSLCPGGPTNSLDDYKGVRAASNCFAISNSTGRVPLTSVQPTTLNALPPPGGIFDGTWSVGDAAKTWEYCLAQVNALGESQLTTWSTATATPATSTTAVISVEWVNPTPGTNGVGAASYSLYRRDHSSTGDVRLVTTGIDPKLLVYYDRGVNTVNAGSSSTAFGDNTGAGSSLGIDGICMEDMIQIIVGGLTMRLAASGAPARQTQAGLGITVTPSPTAGDRQPTVGMKPENYSGSLMGLANGVIQ